jgi:2-polyprenyl-3-methyl-5-hydroxy-6-metoxy-1,4-benzoquinol methylase
LKKQLATIVTGVSCSGKEWLMRHPEINQSYEISFSAEAFDRAKNGYVQRINNVIDNTICLSYLIEGYPLRAIKSLRNRFIDVTFLVTYAPLFLLKDRQKSKGTYKGEKEIKAYYFDLVENYEQEMRFMRFVNTGSMLDLKRIRTPDAFRAEWKLINKKPSKEDEDAFVAGYDSSNQYNTLDLPNHKITGCVPCVETHELIQELGVSYKDKKVVDVGCNEGFHLFKAKEAGAARCVGIDNHERYVRNGKKIAWLKQVPVDFLLQDLNLYTPEKRDITLCLNMLHYTDTKNPSTEFLSEQKKRFLRLIMNRLRWLISLPSSTSLNCRQKKPADQIGTFSGMCRRRNYDQRDK